MVTFGDLVPFIEIVIGINTLSTLFWKSINDLLEESTVEPAEIRKVLVAEKGEPAWEESRARAELRSATKQSIFRNA